MVLDFLSGLFAILGGLTFLIGAIGLIRQDDIYCRISTIATATGLGLGFFIFALVFDDFTFINCLKASAAFFIHLATSAVSGMMIARSAYSSDAKISPKTFKDELKEYRS